MNRMSRVTRIPSPREAAEENDPRFMKRLIVGLATTVVVSGGLGLAGLGLAGTAQARPNPACNDLYPCYTWCPGERLPNSDGPIGWDMSVCHDWYYAHGVGAASQVIEGIPPPQPLPPLWVP
jgi:hypothetical protein